MTTPPYRADHVGSLLRPPALLQAREDFANDTIDADELRAVEDDAIRDAVKLQEEVGLQSATDGEFRRATWHMDFIYQLGGVSKAPGNLKVKFHNAEGDIEWTPAAMHIDGKVTLEKPIFADDFEFLQECVTTRDAEADDPVSPSMVHYRGGRAAIDESRLPRHGRVLGRPHDRLRRPGPGDRRPRLHATCSSTTRASPTSTTRTSAPRWPPRATTPSTCTRPTSATSTRRSRAAPRAWRSPPTCAAATSAARGWPRAATTSSPRRCSTSSTSTASSWSGTTRAPAASSRCASCPRARSSCSGLVTTKTGELETKDQLKRRIEEATQYVDLDQLCLSPQCGFSSTVEGNALTDEQQVDKLRLVVETAEEVWG